MPAFVYLALVASFGASGLYLVLLRRYTVTAMAYLQFATAAVAAAAGVLCGREHLGSSLAAGIVAVIGGLLMLARGRTSHEPSRQEKAISIE